MLAAETLAAVTGVFPSESHPNADDVLASSTIVSEYVSRLRRWVHAPHREGYARPKFEHVPPPSEKRLEAKFAEKVDPVEISVRVPGDDALALAYADLIATARKYLADKWPHIPMPGIKAQSFPLSMEELNDLNMLARVLDDPRVVFDWMDSYSLSIPMVEAFRSIFPELNAILDNELAQILASKFAQTVNNTITWEQDEMLAKYLGKQPGEAVKLDEPKAVAK